MKNTYGLRLPANTFEYRFLKFGFVANATIIDEFYVSRRDFPIRCTRLRPCAHESGSVRLRSQTGTDRPTVHTGSNLSEPVWLRYPRQRDKDKKNGVVWLRSIWLPCEPTDRIQKKVQIGNEADFVCKRGPKHFFVS